MKAQQGLNRRLSVVYYQYSACYMHSEEASRTYFKCASRTHSTYEIFTAFLLLQVLYQVYRTQNGRLLGRYQFFRFRNQEIFRKDWPVLRIPLWFVNLTHPSSGGSGILSSTLLRDASLTLARAIQPSPKLLPSLMHRQIFNESVIQDKHLLATFDVLTYPCGNGLMIFGDLPVDVR